MLCGSYMEVKTHLHLQEATPQVEENRQITMRTRTNLLDFSVASEESRQRAEKKAAVGWLTDPFMSGHRAGILICMVAVQRQE